LKICCENEISLTAGEMRPLSSWWIQGRSLLNICFKHTHSRMGLHHLGGSEKDGCIVDFV